MTTASITRSGKSGDGAEARFDMTRTTEEDVIEKTPSVEREQRREIDGVQGDEHDRADGGEARVSVHGCDKQDVADCQARQRPGQSDNRALPPGSVSFLADRGPTEQWD